MSLLFNFSLLFLSLSLLHSQSLFQKCTSSNLDIAFVIDASPSVDSTEWVQSKSFLTSLLPYLNNPNSRASIFQYNLNSHRELNLTNNWTLVNSTLNTFIRNNDSYTNTVNALTWAWRHLLDFQRNDALPMIFLLTDGEPSDNGLATLANDMKTKGVILVIVGVDEARFSSTLPAAASSSLFFAQARYDQLTDQFIAKVSSSICFDVDGVINEDGSNLTQNYKVEKIAAKVVFIKGSGFFDSTTCLFKSKMNENVTFTSALVNYNVSLASCQIPNIPDDYSLILKSIYWKNTTKSNISITVTLSELILNSQTSVFCQGDTINFQLPNKIRNTWFYRESNKTLAYNKSQGCRSNNDCPYDNYCYNCSLCQGTNCPGCPSLTNGSCYPIKDCFTRNDSIQGCKDIQNPCDCASMHYPFTDSSFLSSSSLGCLSSNQCYLQDSVNCILPNFTINNQNNFFLRKCLPEIDNELINYCEWTDGNSNVTNDNLQVFTEITNKKYLNSMDSDIEFRQIASQNINYDTCYQKCLQTKDCSGFEYPNDGSYCGLWLNTRLKTDNTNLWASFSGRTLILKQLVNVTILIPAIYRDEKTVICPIPSRFSLKANVLKVRIIEQDNLKTGFTALTKYYQGMQWSFCSNCSDLFSENFDFTMNYKKNQSEYCFYKELGLQQVNSSDGNAEYEFSTKSKIKLMKNIDFYTKYPGYDCKGTQNTDYISLTSVNMNEELCAAQCSNRSDCYTFETLTGDSSKCWLWIKPQACTPQTMYANANYNIFTSKIQNNITWTDIAKTTDSVYGYYIYIHQMKLSQNTTNSSILRLYLRESSTNMTVRLFDSSLINSINSSNFTGEINLKRMKFVSGGNLTSNIEDLNNQNDNNDVFLIHSLDNFPSVSNNGLALNFQLGIETNFGNNELSGVTFVITDWARLSLINKGLFPSKFIANCSLINSTLSPRFNKTAKRSEISLKKSKNETFPPLKIGDLFNTLGCYLLFGAEWDAPMPAFISNITTIDPNTLTLTLLHEIILTDIFSFAKIDTSQSKVLSLSDALFLYEGIRVNSTADSQNDWYFEPNTTDTFSNDNKDYLSYKQGNIITPRLNVIISNSTMIKGTFTLEAKFFSKMAAGFDTRNSTNSTPDRRLEFTWAAEKYIEMAKGHESRDIKFFDFDIPIGGIISVGADAGVSISGDIDSNLINSRGSVSSLARMIYNIPKGLASGDVDKTLIDFLPGEAGRVSDAAIEISTTQKVSADFHFVEAGFTNSFSARAEMKKSSEFCGGASEASQTVSQSLSFFVNVPYIGTERIVLDNCERVLGRVCASPFGNKVSKRRFLAQKSNSINAKGIGKVGSGQKSGSCRIINAVSGFLQFLDCLKHKNSPKIDSEMPERAISDWSQRNDGKPIYFTPCKDCTFIVPPMDFDILSYGFPYDNIHSVKWGSISAGLDYSLSDEDNDDDDALSPFSALAFGEPHILTFPGYPILANEIGDFYLLRLGAPMMPGDYCQSQGFLNREEWGLAKELESFASISPDFIGAQIRFLPGAWAPEMTMSVALALKLGEEKVEVLQMLNDPHFDVKVMVNGREYDNSTILSRFKITKLKGNDLLGDAGSFMISNKYFTVKWSPFSVSVSLSSFLTNTGRFGDGCAIRTEGIVGGWESQRLRYRFGNEVDEQNLDSKIIKEYVNSWRVWKNESIISNWLPMYSDNSTKSFDPKKADLGNGTNECQIIYDLVLKNQMRLFESNCWNLKLKKLKSISKFLMEGCLYDYSVTNSENVILNFYKQLSLLKLKEPIACMSPLSILGQMEINATSPILDLKVFMPNVSESFVKNFPNIIFDMDGLTNGSNSDLNLNVFKTNGSIQMNFKKTGNYSIKFGGMFKDIATNMSIFDSFGQFAYKPGMSQNEILVRYLGTENTDDGSFKTKLEIQTILMTLIAGFLLLFGI